MAAFRFRFIMVRPTNALNMGAVARALANFGLKDLAVVEPEEPKWRLATTSAVYGASLLENAPTGPLPDFLTDRNLVLGTASAHNRAVRTTIITLPALRAWLRRRLPQGGNVAVLLGTEKTGLNNEDLSFCNALVRIPTADDAPSMNLGQAAALLAYEISKIEGLEASVTEPEERLVDGKQLAGLTDTAMKAMAKAGVNEHLPPDVRLRKLRDGFHRWRMRRSDASWLQGLLSRLSGS